MSSPPLEILADASPGPFEGPEKLLELWFAPSPALLPRPSHHLGRAVQFRPAKEAGRPDGEGWTGLRKVRREVWEEMLDVVKCKVLSVIEGEDTDAYLLSESSLFVAPHLIILKTCGTTLNLLGLEKILEIARVYCGLDRVWRCFYSRKSFFFPERQIGPHRGWREEVDFLDAIFDKEGAAYTVGPMNGDHWLLYLTNAPEDADADADIGFSTLLPRSASAAASLTPISSIASSPSSSKLGLPRQALPSSIPPTIAPHSASNPPHHLALAAATSTARIQHQDQTLEILMTHLSPRAREPFFHPTHLDPGYTSAEQARSGHYLGDLLSRHLGLDTIFPKEETTLDSFGFEPCGYSANAIVGTGGRASQRATVAPADKAVEGEDAGGYFTVHVTPEEGWSFASFECNVPLPLEPSQRSGADDEPGPSTAKRPDLKTLIRRVVSIFEPSRLSITLFVSTPIPGAPPPVPVQTAAAVSAPFLPGPARSDANQIAWDSFSKDLLGPEYVRKDRIGYEFDGYDLIFGCFEKRGWRGPKGPDGPVV